MARRRDDNRQRRRPVEARFFEDLSDDEGRTAPFLIRLPAGRYEITSWKLDLLTGEDAQDAPGVEFEVRPGVSVCIGALYPLHLRRASGVPYTTALIPRDECLIIDQQLRARAPRDMPRVETELAANRLCASCRAEVAQGGLPALTGVFDSAALPLLVAEQHRLGDADDLPLRWPREVDSQPRPLKLNVCVATDGRVYDAAGAGIGAPGAGQPGAGARAGLALPAISDGGPPDAVLLPAPLGAAAAECLRRGRRRPGARFRVHLRQSVGKAAETQRR